MTELDNILSDKCQKFIHQMMLAVSEAGGAGIAAPQINHSMRIFIMCSKPNPSYPDVPLMPPISIVNPEILYYSSEKEKGWEDDP